MTKPDWFLPIEGWKPHGMGTTGPTLSFVVGALAHRSGSKPKSASEIRYLLDAMATLKVPGQYIHVSWCPTIEAPVFSLCEQPKPAWKIWPGGDTAEHAPLEFGPDIRSKAGFNCSDQAACIRKIADDAWESVELGDFSRSKGASGMCEYGPFHPHEIQFIERVLAPHDRGE